MQTIIWLKTRTIFIFIILYLNATLSAGAVEYDCISVLSMTLNCYPGALGNMEYSFIAITLRSTLMQSGNTY